jgi:proline iminopeptidase
MQIKVNGVRLFFDVEGSAFRPPLLILHGGPGIDHSPYRELGPRLSPFFQVFYLDQRGSGRSEAGAPETWNLDTWAADVFHFCEALGLEKPTVLGHSFGGYVAQAYASRYPEHPSRLILAGTAPRFRKERSLAAFERSGGAQAATVARNFFAAPLAHFQEYLSVCYPLYGMKPAAPEIMARMIIKLDVADFFVGGAMQSFDLRPQLKELSAPVLILSAERDVIATPADIEDLKQALRPELVTHHHCAEAGHEIFRDADEEAVAAILRFAFPSGDPYAYQADYR